MGGIPIHARQFAASLDDPKVTFTVTVKPSHSLIKEMCGMIGQKASDRWYPRP
jgi:hypothetical protein